MYKRKPKLDKEIHAYLATLKDNKTDNTKRQVIEGLLDSVTRNPGAYGCIMEIMCGGSRKKFVSAEGKPDMYFYYNGKRLQAECKTSGGRIGSLLYGDNKAKFIAGTQNTLIKLYPQASFCDTAFLNGTSANVAPIEIHASGDAKLLK